MTRPGGRLFVILPFVAALLFASHPVTASTFANVRVRPGVEVGVVWLDGPAGPITLPVAEGRRLPVGQTRLRITVPGDLVDPRAHGYSLSFRLKRRASRTYPLAARSAGGALSFEIPLDFGQERRSIDLETTLLVDRRPLGIDRVDLLAMTYVPDAGHVRVISVTRYPRLAWQDCPAPCFRPAPGLVEIGADEWRRSLRVFEVGPAGLEREIQDFDVRFGPERPASIVFLVDSSGSILREGRGSPSRSVMRYLETFPDEAYGKDRVRALDRLGALFFHERVLGYYDGHLTDAAEAGGISSSRRYFAPDELASSWGEFCETMRGGAPDGTVRVARLDDAWLVAAQASFGDSGYALPASSRRAPWERVCAMRASPDEVLDELRFDSRRCVEHGECRGDAPGTDILAALRRAAADLALLHLDSRSRSEIRDNQQAVVLISDVLDLALLRGDEEARQQRWRAMKKELAGGTRFFFVDIHSRRVLVRRIAQALTTGAPLWRATVRGIDRHVDDPELALLLVNALTLPREPDLRQRARDALDRLPAGTVVPASPFLESMLRDRFARSETLESAFSRALERALPDRAKQILGGRTDGHEVRHAAGIDDPWLREVAALAALHHPRELRKMPDARRIRQRLELVERDTIGSFVRLAKATDGLAIQVRDCSYTTTDGERLEGAVCAFRSILDALRGTLRVTYERDEERPVSRVGIELTPSGKRLLADRGMIRARVESVGR